MKTSKPIVLGAGLVAGLAGLLLLQRLPSATISTPQPEGAAQAAVPRSLNSTGQDAGFNRTIAGPSNPGGSAVSPPSSPETVEKQKLIERLSLRDGLTNKAAEIKRLTILGGDDAAQALIDLLAADHRSYTYSQNTISPEVWLLGNTVYSLGLIGRKSELAINFLRAQARPEAWQQRVTWNPDGEAHYRLDILLAGRAIEGLGVAHNRALWEEIERLRALKWNPGEGRKIGAHFLSAVYLYEKTTAKSAEELLNRDLGEEASLYHEWKQSFLNSEIYKWYEEQKRLSGEP